MDVWLIRLLLAIPALDLAYMALSWLVNGLDLPFFDDWRAYATGKVGSAEINYLFRPINDTQSPVGLALDAFAQRYLHGNAIAYQFISMTVVLGSLLALQWNLLKSAISNRLLAATAFGFTILMLQPGSYWGRENLAFHQAIPLVTLLTSYYVSFVADIALRWRSLSLFLLGIVGGFTYISGAITTLVSGFAMLIASIWLNGHQRKTILASGIAMSLAGLISATSQFYAVVVMQAGRLNRPHLPIVLPDSGDFWMFFLGKVGRSLALPANQPVMSLTLVILGGVVISALAILAMKQMAVSRHDSASLRQPVIFLLFPCLLLSTIAYLGVVTAGRAGYRPAEIDSSMEVFSFGFTRFHFFWVTAIWPWCAAMLFWIGGQRIGSIIPSEKSRRLVIRTLAIAVVVLLGFMVHIFDHAAYFKSESQARQATINCLQEQIANGNGIQCQEFKWASLNDLASGYVLAKKLDTSFVRYFPTLQSDQLVKREFPLLLEWPGTTGDVRLENFKDRTAPYPIEFRPQTISDSINHTGILLTSNDANVKGKCFRVELTLKLHSKYAANMILAANDRGELGSNQILSRSAEINGAETLQDITLNLESHLGFGREFSLIVDRMDDRIRLERISMRCRLSSL